MAKDAGHDDVNVTRKHDGDVFRRFALTEADVGRGEVDGVSAELGHARLKRNARSQRGLLKDHRQRLARKRTQGVCRRAGAVYRIAGAVRRPRAAACSLSGAVTLEPFLQLPRRLQDGQNLLAREIQHRQEISALKINRHRNYSR